MVELSLVFRLVGAAHSAVKEGVFGCIEDPVAGRGIGFEDFGGRKVGEVARRISLRAMVGNRRTALACQEHHRGV